VLEGDALAFILRIALLMCLGLAIFAFLGGVLHARRLEVSFEPEHSPKRRRSREEKDRDRERDRFIDRVFAEFRAGGRGNPWATVEERATRSPTPLTEYDWFYERVATWPNPKLTERARDAGDRPLARALLTDFDQYFPDDRARIGARRFVEQVARLGSSQTLRCHVFLYARSFSFRATLPQLSLFSIWRSASVHRSNVTCSVMRAVHAVDLRKILPRLKPAVSERKMVAHATRSPHGPGDRIGSATSAPSGDSGHPGTRRTT
jgi:hypothetical protein